MKTPNVLVYSDITTLLKRVYILNNERGKFSYRTIAKDFNSKVNLIYGYFNGNIRMPLTFAEKIISLLKLKGKAKEYFVLLVYLSKSDMPKK